MSKQDMGRIFVELVNLGINMWLCTQILKIRLP